MKPRIIKNIVLLLLPLVACGIAATPGSVTVVKNGTTQMLSYMQLVQESPVGWCAPLAAILNYAVFALAVLHVVAKKGGFLKGVFGCSFASMTLAVIPVLARGELMIIPNVFFALVIGAECLLSYFMKRETKNTKANAAQGPRLDIH